MAVFACALCGAALTVLLSQIVLPVHAHQKCGHALLPVLMEPKKFAVDPEPSGPPWRPWSEVRAGEAEDRGLFAPTAVSLSGHRERSPSRRVTPAAPS